MDNRIESDLRKYGELEIIFGTSANKIADEIAQWKSRYYDMDALVDGMRAEVLKLKETIRIYDKRIVALGCIAMEDTKQFCVGTKNCGELHKAERDALRTDADRYRWVIKNRPVLLCTGFFGNGCSESTDDVSKKIDAAIAGEKLAQLC